MLKRFVVRFRVPLLILALLISLGGNILLGLRLYRSAAIRSDAASYHAGTLNTLWQAVLDDIAAAVDARDRDVTSRPIASASGWCSRRCMARA